VRRRVGVVANHVARTVASSFGTPPKAPLLRMRAGGGEDYT
jgi:hypothetical protein